MSSRALLYFLFLMCFFDIIFTTANLEKITNFTKCWFHTINVKMINEDTCMLQMPQCYFRCLKHIFNSDLCSEISVSNIVNTYSSGDSIYWKNRSWAGKIASLVKHDNSFLLQIRIANKPWRRLNQSLINWRSSGTNWASHTKNYLAAEQHWQESSRAWSWRVG